MFDARVFPVLASPDASLDGIDEIVAGQLGSLERAMVRAPGGTRRCERACQPVLASLSCLAYGKDADGRYLYINSAGERALGKAAHEWHGRTDAELHPPELASDYALNERRVLESAKAVQALEVIPSPEGPRQWLISRFPLEVRHGRVELIGAVGVDVTAPLAAPPSALEARAGWELLDSLGWGSYCISADGALVSANRTLARMLGFRETADLLAEAARQWRPTGELARVFRQLNGSSCLHKVTTRWLTRSGGELSVSEHVHAFRDGDGAIEWLRGVIQPAAQTGATGILDQARTQLLEMVIRNEPLGDVLAEVCSLVEWHVSWGRCLMLLLRDQRLEPVAGSDPFNDAARFDSLLTELAAGAALVSLDLPNPAASGIAIPIWSPESRLLGAVLVWRAKTTEPQSEPLPHAEAEFLQSATRLAALAIEHAQLHESLIHQARYDKLTGLPNQWLLENRLERALDAAGECNARIAPLWIDLDRFKEINDTDTGSAMTSSSRRPRACPRSRRKEPRWPVSEVMNSPCCCPIPTRIRRATRLAFVTSSGTPFRLMATRFS
jgi:PAS domain-containing protein